MKIKAHGQLAFVLGTALKIVSLLLAAGVGYAIAHELPAAAVVLAIASWLCLPHEVHEVDAERETAS